MDVILSINISKIRLQNVSNNKSYLQLNQLFPYSNNQKYVHPFLV